MLVYNSQLIGTPVLSVQASGPIAQITSPIVNPDNLKILAFKLDGPIINTTNYILDVKSVREYSHLGMVIDDNDELVGPEDVVKIKEVLDLNFNLIGLKVETKKGTKLGHIIDFTLTSEDFTVFNRINHGNGGVELSQSLDPVLANFQSDLDSTIAMINSIKDSEIFQNLVSLLQNSPSTIADFISSPVAANEIKVYPISSYGSEMAPFYSVLACWVGCTILVAIISLDVKKSRAAAKANTHQKFLGRFMLFGSIAMLQGLAIGIGDLIMQVQTVNWPLFLITLMLSSLVFALIIYALAATFGKIGQALSIILLVLQVAGSGGTFPIELLPQMFQVLQPFMPFAPAMNAVRETVGGFYQYDYLLNLAILLIFFIIALIFGLIFSKHTFEAKGKFQKDLESTGLIS